MKVFSNTIILFIAIFIIWLFYSAIEKDVERYEGIKVVYLEMCPFGSGETIETCKTNKFEKFKLQFRADFKTQTVVELKQSSTEKLKECVVFNWEHWNCNNWNNSLYTMSSDYFWDNKNLILKNSNSKSSLDSYTRQISWFSYEFH